jgi:HD-GYP domain-containing protein (c-di-GMP phosphodiesterase class II)
VDAYHTLEGVETCFLDLGETLLTLAQGRTLNGEQRTAVHKTVSALLQSQNVLLEDFHAAFGPEELAVYRATLGRDAPTGEQAAAPGGDAQPPDDPRIDEHLVLGSVERRAPLVDEVLYFFGLIRLTTISGAETRGHLTRTAQLSRSLCEVLDCDPQFVATLAYAAELHDVGLVAVPERLLQSRGKIDSQELLLIDTHTKVGAYLINSVADQLHADSGPLPMAADIALHHHERYDGLGPHGISGSDIPYPARIFQIVDVYDTLRRGRPYRAALGHAAAVETMRSANSGGAQQFDPALMPAFLHAADQFAAICNALPDAD